MALPQLNLDDRDFEQLFEEARSRISRYLPEWTDHNDSDAGITLLQLFTWLTETMIFRLNQVPEKQYLKFLELLGLELRPPQPATTHLRFEADSVAEALVPLGARAFAQGEDGQLVFFETERDLELSPWDLVDVFVHDGLHWKDMGLQLEDEAGSFAPFGKLGLANAALYLGFEMRDGRVDPPKRLRFRLWRADSGVPAEKAWEGSVCWEVKTKDVDWQPLHLIEDETQELRQEGYVELVGLERASLQSLRPNGPNRYWLRARVERAWDPSSAVVEIDAIDTDTVAAVQLVTERDELLPERTKGLPNEEFALRHAPVERESIELVTVTEKGDETRWSCVTDLGASNSDELHFLLDPLTGRIRFGDGKHGAIPVRRSSVIAQRYRHGGGGHGNVGSMRIQSLQGKLKGVARVFNRRGAVGGADVQTLEELKVTAPALLRHRDRAVTDADYRDLALEVGGVAQAKVVSLRHPIHRGLEVPGALTIYILPKFDSYGAVYPPMPSEELCSRVRQYLEPRRLVTTEVHVSGPRFRMMQVRSTIDIDTRRSRQEVEQDLRLAIRDYVLKRGQQARAGATSSSLIGGARYASSLLTVLLEVRGVVNIRGFELLVDGVSYGPEGVVELDDDELFWDEPRHELQLVAGRNYS